MALQLSYGLSLRRTRPPHIYRLALLEHPLFLPPCLSLRYAPKCPNPVPFSQSQCPPSSFTHLCCPHADEMVLTHHLRPSVAYSIPWPLVILTRPRCRCIIDCMILYVSLAGPHKHANQIRYFFMPITFSLIFIPAPQRPTAGRSLLWC